MDPPGWFASEVFLFFLGIGINYVVRWLEYECQVDCLIELAFWINCLLGCKRSFFDYKASVRRDVFACHFQQMCGNARKSWRKGVVSKGPCINYCPCVGIDHRFYVGTVRNSAGNFPGRIISC